MTNYRLNRIRKLIKKKTTINSNNQNPWGDVKSSHLILFKISSFQLKLMKQVKTTRKYVLYTGKKKAFYKNCPFEKMKMNLLKKDHLF